MTPPRSALSESPGVQVRRGGTWERAGAPSPLRVAYLVNRYPKVSHSFIRREILALERQGCEVLRFAVRGRDEVVADPEDLAERDRTRYLLDGGAPALAAAMLGSALRHPRRFIAALRLALRMARRADRPWPVHLVYLAEACRLAAWCRGAGVSHLHAHFGTNPAEVAMLAEVIGGPGFSFTVHGPEEFDKPEFLGLAEKLRRARFAVAISSFGRSQLYRWLDASQWAKVAVVHCGLEPAFHEVEPRVPQRGRLVCVGRLCEQKGQLLLLRAARRLADRGLDFTLVLAGDGEMRALVDAEIARLGLQRQVRVTGWLASDAVREEILAAQALVLPSFAEGLPVVLMEAMALRRPVVTTAVAGIPELVRPGEHGWLVTPGDVDALAEAMAECLGAGDAARQAMGERARARVLARHDVDREAAALRRLFAAAATGEAIAEVVPREAHA